MGITLLWDCNFMINTKCFIESDVFWWHLLGFVYRFDKDGSMSVTREEFATGIEVCQLVNAKYTMKLKFTQISNLNHP